MSSASLGGARRVAGSTLIQRGFQFGAVGAEHVDDLSPEFRCSAGSCRQGVRVKGRGKPLQGDLGHDEEALREHDPSNRSQYRRLEWAGFWRAYLLCCLCLGDAGPDVGGDAMAHDRVHECVVQ